MHALANFRDLGGHPVRDGGVTATGSIFRSAHPDAVDARGWSKLSALGIRTVIDLRNSSERDGLGTPPPEILVVHLPLEKVDDPRYISKWDRNWATPDFYAWGRVHWPELWADVFSAIAEAPGGVLIHCAAGRDRTGMVTALLLEGCGVVRQSILDDYQFGIVEATDRGIDEHVLEYRERLDRLLDDLSPEPALLRAAGRLFPAPENTGIPS